MADQRTADRSFTTDVEAVLAASRVLIGVAARSLAAVEDTVTLTQVRALVIIGCRGQLDLAALAADPVLADSGGQASRCHVSPSAGQSSVSRSAVGQSRVEQRGRHCHRSRTGLKSAMLGLVL